MYTLKDFIKESSQQQLFIKGLPSKISPQEAEEKFKSLDIELQDPIGDQRINRRTIFDGGFPKHIIT